MITQFSFIVFSILVFAVVHFSLRADTSFDKEEASAASSLDRFCRLAMPPMIILTTLLMVIYGMTLNNNPLNVQ